MLTASDAVASAAQDEDCYLAVFVDGKAAGQTAVALKSKEKAWGEVLPVGNHLFRFEEWVKPPSGQWTPLPADWQPTERFIRVEPGLRTVVSLKFYDAGRRHSLEISRFPLTVLP
ncbi:MAG: hypothetical protein KGK30_04140 [Elusimicrobia bacterium]|nr:hypothetical protein [Elusimicrobiota bacterium]